MISKSTLTLRTKMKALSAVFVAGAMCNPVTAATIYDNGKGLTYSLKADWQVQFKKDIGDNQDLQLDYDDLELKNVITYDLGNGMKAFGEVHFSFDPGANTDANSGGRDTARREEAFLGLEFGGNQTIRVGQLNTAGDEFGVEQAYEKVGVAEDGFEDLKDMGFRLTRYDGNFGPLSVVASYDLEEESENAGGDSWFDVFVSYKVAGVKFAVAYMDYQASPSADSDEVNGVSASWGPVGVDYSVIDRENDTEKTIWNVAGKFKVGPTGTVRVGIDNEDDDALTDDVTGWYTSYTYQFASQKNVSLFVELGDNDRDNTSMGYLFGMQIKM
jgi:hypothetical protein